MLRFAIVAPQRSGSTWFRDLVRSHPRASVAKEVFLDVERKELALLGDAKGLRWARTWRYLAALERRGFAEPRESGESGATGAPAAFGFKVMYNHLDARPEILPFLAARGYRALHVVRGNLLDVYLSRLRAERTGVFHSNAEVATELLEPDPAEMLRSLRSLDRQVRRKRLAMRMLPMRSLEVGYEDLVARRDEVMQSVFEFLELEPGEATLEEQRKKLAREPVAARLRNAEAIGRALRGTPWAGFLKD